VGLPPGMICCGRIVFSRHHRKVKFLFGLADILIVAIAFDLAYRTRLALILDHDFYLEAPVKAVLLGAAAVLWPLTGIWLRVYDRLDAERLPVILRDTFRQCAVSAVGLILVEYSLRIDLSRLFLAFFLSYVWILLLLFRGNAPRIVGWLRRGFGEPYYVLIVGTGSQARQLGRQLEKSADQGMRLMGFLSAGNGESEKQIRLGDAYPVYPISKLPELLVEKVIDEIIFAVDSRDLAAMEETLLLCDEDGVRTRVAVDFFPNVNSDVYLDRLDSIPLLTFSAAPDDEIRLMIKRLIDVVVSAVVLVVLAIPMLVIAALIRLTSPGKAIFRQERCGLNGRRFTCYKFRSMCDNAEQIKASLEHLNEKRPAFKITNDPRVTPIGRLLRKFSIDELPQFWNVLKGDMSLVGPRPPVPEEVARYERWQHRRLRMRPGLTCLWALEGRDKLDFETWMRKDLAYIDTWSLWLDTKILLRTIPHVLAGKGAH